MSEIRSDDYLVNVKAVYVLDMLGVSDLTYFEDPEKNRSVYREEVEVDAASYTICYKRGFGYEALATHTLTTKETSYLLKELTESFAEVAALPAPALDEEAPAVWLRLTYQSGAQITYLCNFERRFLPARWLDFRNDIKAKFDFYNMRGDLLSEKLIRYGRREGETIVCTVSQNGAKEQGLYRTEDDSIREGDRVALPEGTGRVEKVEYFTPENVPAAPESLPLIVKRIHP